MEINYEKMHHIILLVAAKITPKISLHLDLLFNPEFLRNKQRTQEDFVKERVLSHFI